MELLSQMWSLLGLLTVLQNILPSQLLSLLHSLWQSLQDSLTPYSYFDVPEFLGSSSVTPNPLYRHAHLYLHHHRSLLLLSSPPPRLTLSGPGPGPCHSLSLSPGHSVTDSFDGHRLLWTLHADTLNDSLEERRSFTLRLPKHHSSALLQPYLSHLSASASAFDASSRDRRIHTNTTFHTWSSVPFRHPATFDTLALDPDLKAFLVSDIEAFSKAGEFYRRIGRPWKRGYLLYGPPGSGKSSLIAAIANCLNYDVFDLELTRVANNSDLRSLLIQTTNRSVIVIEDIDCSLHLTGDRSHKKRRLHANSSSDDHDSDDDVNIEKDNNSRSNNSERVTLSGLLNFTDGLWSCCGDERIIIFTTNYKDGVDEALLRAGRMDVHVRLGECGVHAMREMVERYIGVAEEVKEMVGVAESCIRAGAAMTPAEIGEVLMRSREDRVAAVRELVGELQARIVGGDGSEGEEEVSSPGGKGTKRKGWEGRVRFLGRLKSLTKSDSGRRGV